MNLIKVAILVHGFNVRDKGEKTIDKLKPFLIEEGYYIIEFDYDWTGVLRVRLYNNSLAMAICSVSKHFSDCWVVAFGHSNGCSIIHKAAHKGAFFNEVVYINPALDKDAPLASQIKTAHVWHSISDKPVRIARWFIKHSWGEMGATGYVGNDKRYKNYDKENGLRFIISSNSHSDIFETEKINYFAPLILNELSN